MHDIMMMANVSDTGEADCWRLAIERNIFEYRTFSVSKRLLIKLVALKALTILTPESASSK